MGRRQRHREAVSRALGRYEEKSLRRLAKDAGLSYQTILKLRMEQVSLTWRTAHRLEEASGGVLVADELMADSPHR